MVNLTSSFPVTSVFQRAQLPADQKPQLQPQMQPQPRVHRPELVEFMRQRGVCTFETVNVLERPNSHHCWSDATWAALFKLGYSDEKLKQKLMVFAGKDQLKVQEWIEKFGISHNVESLVQNDHFRNLSWNLTRKYFEQNDPEQWRVITRQLEGRGHRSHILQLLKHFNVPEEILLQNPDEKALAHIIHQYGAVIHWKNYWEGQVKKAHCDLAFESSTQSIANLLCPEKYLNHGKFGKQEQLQRLDELIRQSKHVIEGLENDPRRRANVQLFQLFLTKFRDRIENEWPDNLRLNYQDWLKAAQGGRGDSIRRLLPVSDINMVSSLLLQSIFLRLQESWRNKTVSDS